MYLILRQWFPSVLIVKALWHGERIRFGCRACLILVESDLLDSLVPSLNQRGVQEWSAASTTISVHGRYLSGRVGGPELALRPRRSSQLLTIATGRRLCRGAQEFGLELVGVINKCRWLNAVFRERKITMDLCRVVSRGWACVSSCRECTTRQH